MPSSRCPQCAIDFPSHFQVCLVKECREKLLLSPYGTPDSNWQGRVEKRNKDSGIELQTDRWGQTWLSGVDAERLGYAVVTGTILELGGSFWEVAGWSAYKEAHWLEEVIVAGAADSLEPHMFLGPEA